MLHGLALPKVSGKHGLVSFFGRLTADDQTGKDAVQMANDLIFQHRAHFDFALADPVQMLQFQINTLHGLKGTAFTPAQQVTNGGHIDRVIFLAAHHLLGPILADGIAVNQGHRLGPLL